jgi:hypothetical protein
MPITRRFARWAILPCLVTLASVAAAVDAPASSSSIALAPIAPPPGKVTQLQGVSVSGVQPGPGLWKVSKGDHVLWVLGTLDLLPKHMDWQARDVQAVIAESQQVLDRPQVKVDAKLGFFGTLGLLPSLIGVRNNPDGKHLVDVVPPEQYARWLVLKKRYLGWDNGVEKQRPIFAAATLFIAAIKQADLSTDMLDPLIKKAAAQHGLKPTPVTYTIVIEQPKAVVKDFKKSSLDDGDCFAKTLDHLDRDVALMRARANAWATGDLDTLRRLPLSDQLQVCLAAVNASGMAHELGLNDIEAHVKATWVAAASKALQNNRVTFAQLPMQRLLGGHSDLDALQAMGYVVTLPDGLNDGATEPAAAATTPAATGGAGHR